MTLQTACLKSLLVAIAFTITWVLATCSTLTAQENAGEKVTFDDHVKPIFRQRCAACHGPDKKSGGLDLTNFTAMMLGGSSGAAVEPGDAEGSYLYMLITHEEEPVMPPGPNKIPDAEIDLISKWISAGALENKESKSRVKKKSFDMAASGSSMEKPAVIALPPHLPLEPVLHTAKPGCSTAVAVSPWAPIAAVAAPKQILLYNTQSLELIGVLEFPEGTVNVLRFSQNGHLLLAGGGQDAVSGKVVLWDVATGTRQLEVGDELDTVLAADISSDQRWIALGGPKKVVRVFSTADGSQVYELTKHTDWITSLAFSPDSVLLATGDRAGGTLVWEAPTGNEYLILKGHTAQITGMSWRTDSNLLATSSEDVTVRLWEMENGSQVKSFNAHGGGTTSVQFNRDGLLVSNGRDKVTKVWNQNGEVQKQFSAFPDIGTTVAYCHETGRVIAGDWSGQVLVWNVADAAQVGALDLNPPPLTERVAQAEGVVAASQAALEPAAAELTQTQKAMTDLQAQVAAAVATKDTLTNEMTTIQQALTTAQQTLEAKLAQKKQMETELGQGTQLLPQLSELSEKATAVAALAPQDAELQAAAATVATKVTALKTKVDELTKQLAEVAAQSTLTEQEVQAMQSQITAKQEALNGTVAQITAMESQIAPLQTTVTEKTSLVAQLTEQFNAAQQNLARWQNEVSFISQLSALEEKITAAQSAVDTQATNRAELEKKLAELQAQIEAVRLAEQQATQELNQVADEKNKLQGIAQ